MRTTFTRAAPTLAIAALIALAGCSSDSGSDSEDAAKFPDRTIEMWIGTSAGGGTDTHARLLAPCLKDELSQEVVVVNKPAASGLSLWNSIPKIDPNGYVISLVSFPQVAGEYVKGTLTYNPTEDLEFIGNASINPTAMAVAGDADFSSLEELVAAAEAKPGDIKVGTTGGGSLDYLAAESVAQAAGVEFTYVPFEGTTEGIEAVLSGDIDAMGMGLVSAGAFVDSGDLKLIAIGSDERLESYPDTSTYQEQGYEILGGSPVAYFSIVAPKGLPEEVSTKLNAAVETCTEEPSYVEQIEAIGGGVQYLSPDDLTSLIDSQLTELDKVMETE